MLDWGGWKAGILLGGLLFGFMWSGNAFAEPVTAETVRNLELSVFGKAFPQDSFDDRLSRLEAQVMQKTFPQASPRYRVEALLASRKAKLSEKTYREAIGLYNQGIDAVTKGRVEQAVGFYQDAIHLHPGFVAAYNNLGNLLDQLQRLPEAMGVYEQGIKEAEGSLNEKSSPELQEGAALLHRNLGILYEKSGRIQDSLKAYRQYLRLAKAPDPAIVKIVKQYWVQREQNQGVQDYTRFAKEATQGTLLIWPRVVNPIPVHVYLEEDQVIFLPAVQEALREWEQATRRRITFKEVGASAQAFILIRLQPGPLTHPTLEVGHARFDLPPSSTSEEGEERLGMRVFITVNTGERELPISLPDRLRMVKRLALHEVGHSVGIWGHSPDPSDIMYARPIVDTLSKRDVRTVNELYASEY